VHDLRRTSPRARQRRRGGNGFFQEWFLTEQGHFKAGIQTQLDLRPNFLGASRAKSL
jgi:hypothetical protein